MLCWFFFPFYFCLEKKKTMLSVATNQKKQKQCEQLFFFFLLFFSLQIVSQVKRASLPVPWMSVIIAGRHSQKVCNNGSFVLKLQASLQDVWRHPTLVTYLIVLSGLTWDFHPLKWPIAHPVHLPHSLLKFCKCLCYKLPCLYL